MLQRRTDEVHKELQEAGKAALAHRALQAQQSSLESWAGSCWDHRHVSEAVSHKLGRPPQTVVFTKSLPLPPLQDHRGPSFGPKSDFPQRRQKKLYPPADAFFRLPEKIGPEDDSFKFSLGWTERQMYKPPVSIARPDLGEQLWGADSTAPRRPVGWQASVFPAGSRGCRVCGGAGRRGGGVGRRRGVEERGRSRPVG